MPFLFASSHLPAARSTRPELEEEEEENVNPESLPRSGGVRASSHLEERAADSARRADGSPAPRRADAASDSPGRLKELAEQQRTRSAPAAPDERPRRADAEPEPDAEPDHDADEASGAEDEEAPEHGEEEDAISWYRPPESSSYHPDPGFYVRQEDVGPASPDHGFDQHLPEGEERGASDAWGGGEHPSSQEWRVRRSGKGRGLSQGSQRGVGSDAPAGSIASPMPVATTSRLFEKRSAPDAFIKQQQQVRRSRGPAAQQGFQGAPQAIAAQQQVRGASPAAHAPGGKPTALDLAVSPNQGQAQAPEKMNERSAAPPNHSPESKKTGAQRPGRSTDSGPKNSIELNKIEDEMRKLLLERRAAYDRMKNGNMPLSTDELTKLMELDYQRGLIANSAPEGMSFNKLKDDADDRYLYHIEPNKMNREGHEGFRGSGFALVESPEPKFDNPHIKKMARGYSDPYFGWEINYNVVGQWLRIAGYSKAEASLFLNAWLATSPTKWGSLNLDRQTWFWIGYDYADARQKGWHPAAKAPEAKPTDDRQTTPPPLP